MVMKWRPHSARGPTVVQEEIPKLKARANIKKYPSKLKVGKWKGCISCMTTAATVTRCMYRHDNSSQLKYLMITSWAIQWYSSLY